MKNNRVSKVEYELRVNEEELSILASTLQYCLFENKKFMCCPDCRDVGIELLQELMVLFKKNHKHI